MWSQPKDRNAVSSSWSLKSFWFPILKPNTTPIFFLTAKNPWKTIVGRRSLSFFGFDTSSLINFRGVTNTTRWAELSKHVEIQRPAVRWLARNVKWLGDVVNFQSGNHNGLLPLSLASLSLSLFCSSPISIICEYLVVNFKIYTSVCIYK